MHWLIILFLIVLTWAGLFSIFDIVSTQFLLNYTSNTPWIKLIYYAIVAAMAILILYVNNDIRVLISTEEHAEVDPGAVGAEVVAQAGVDSM